MFPTKPVQDNDLRNAAENLVDNLDQKLDAAALAIVNSPDLDLDDQIHILGSIKNLKNHHRTLRNELLAVFQAEPEPES